MFNVYGDHKGSFVKFPPEHSVEAVRILAEASARLGHDNLLRVFEVTDKSPTGEQFVTAFSVLGGVVREHQDVTIPLAHW